MRTPEGVPIPGAGRPDRVEEPIDPDLEIVDPHHHLWSSPEPGYLITDLVDDASASGHNVVQSVYIEAGWGVDPTAPPELAPVPEVALAARSAAEGARLGPPVVSGIVGHADLRLGRAAGRTLDAMAEAAGPLLVGVRHTTAWDADPAAPAHRHRPTPGLMAEAAWRAGFAELAGRGLAFDAWVYHRQLAEVGDLAAAFPDVPVVVDHLGGPLRVGSCAGRFGDVLAACRTSFAELSRRPNVCLKLGGIGMQNIGTEWVGDRAEPSSVDLADLWGDHIRRCIDTFGPDRCMFESNFPVDRATCSYGVLWNAFKRIVADASPAERAALFAGTARAVYGLPRPADGQS